MIAARGTPKPSRYGRGLEGLVAGDTAISTIDGINGRLSIRGYAIEDLAANTTFESLTHLTLFGDLPSDADEDRWTQRLARWRELPPSGLRAIAGAPADTDLFALYRLGVTASSADVPGSASGTDDPARILSWTAGLAAASIRHGRGESPLPARDGLGYSAHLLWLITGNVPSVQATRALDVSLIVQAEHGLHAAALAALVVWSGGGTLDDAVLAGIAALGGPLHGGANRPAYQTLLDLDSPQQAREWATARIAEKHRFPGYGHRVYKSRDPRAKLLEPHALALLEAAGQSDRWDIHLAVKDEIERALGSKGIYANIDAITGLVYAPIGIPLDAFTIPFCLAIQTGWMAHCLEYGPGRVVQPDTLFVKGAST